jgi:hypothetical protein
VGLRPSVTADLDIPASRLSFWALIVLNLFREHQELLAWLGVLSVFTFVGSLLLIPFLVVRMGEDYFMPHRDDERTFAGAHPALRVAGLVLKNVLGLLLLAAGIAMLVLPGQGLLTMVMGIMLMDFPGKRAFEMRLIRIPALLRAVNGLRAKAHRPPLQLPARPSSHTSG